MRPATAVEEVVVEVVHQVGLGGTQEVQGPGTVLQAMGTEARLRTVDTEVMDLLMAMEGRLMDTEAHRTDTEAHHLHMGTGGQGMGVDRLQGTVMEGRQEDGEGGARGRLCGHA